MQKSGNIGTMKMGIGKEHRIHVVEEIGKESRVPSARKPLILVSINYTHKKIPRKCSVSNELCMLLNNMAFFYGLFL